MSRTNNFDILRMILTIAVFVGHWNILTNADIENRLFHLESFAVDLFFRFASYCIRRSQLSQSGVSSNKLTMRKDESQMYINISKRTKNLILPCLFIFSLLKHLRYMIKDFFAKN